MAERFPFRRGPDTFEHNLHFQASQIENFFVPGFGHIFNLSNPNGIETLSDLDKRHLPRLTGFDTVVYSREFAGLIGKKPQRSPAFEVGGDPSLLMAISEIASKDESYDEVLGRELREQYLKAMTEAARRLFDFDPINPETDIVVGIERCGANLARALGIDFVSVEVKRLNFREKGERKTILGAGITAEDEALSQMAEKRVRVLEGVIASGSSIIALLALIKNHRVPVNGVDCDSVIICPGGARLLSKVRWAMGISGRDRGVFVGGTLDEKWYVRFHEQDPLRQHWGDRAGEIVGAQVLGDGGDLTSNI